MRQFTRSVKSATYPRHRCIQKMSASWTAAVLHCLVLKNVLRRLHREDKRPSQANKRAELHYNRVSKAIPFQDSATAPHTGSVGGTIVISPLVTLEMTS